MKKIVSIWIAALLVAGGGAFYGGMKYAQSTQATAVSSDALARGQRGFGGRGNGGGGQGFTIGDIIAKDDKSVTIKLRDGGSKIIFFSDATAVSKSVAGAVGDMAVGNTVMVSGDANGDGSMTARFIQIRPHMPASNTKQ